MVYDFFSRPKLSLGTTPPTIASPPAEFAPASSWPWSLAAAVRPPRAAKKPFCAGVRPTGAAKPIEARCRAACAAAASCLGGDDTGEAGGTTCAVDARPLIRPLASASGGGRPRGVGARRPLIRPLASADAGGGPRGVGGWRPLSFARAEGGSPPRGVGGWRPLSFTRAEAAAKAEAGGAPRGVGKCRPLIRPLIRPLTSAEAGGTPRGVGGCRPLSLTRAEAAANAEAGGGPRGVGAARPLAKGCRPLGLAERAEPRGKWRADWFSRAETMCLGMGPLRPVVRPSGMGGAASQSAAAARPLQNGCCKSCPAEVCA